MSAAAHVTRRQFLRRSALAASSAAVLPQILPRGVLAADGQPGANDRIGVGFIAIGRQASALLAGAVRLKETRVVGFADAHLGRAREFAARHQAEAYQDYRRLLERRDVDAIFTATPDHWRALVCIHACQAGKDVYGGEATDPDHPRRAADGRGGAQVPAGVPDGQSAALHAREHCGVQSGAPRHDRPHHPGGGPELPRAVGSGSPGALDSPGPGLEPLVRAGAGRALPSGLVLTPGQSRLDFVPPVVGR
ncbi:MAG: Gfo/Idh/MocA family oxidoreductase [Verrucomicrobia bacterium]|nr:Gfo/Idh/MocA family oxidoreductase [Verrucomicrobiota bacterium]